MKLQHSFTVPLGVDDAWVALNDIEGIAPCFPGATITSVEGDEFAGTAKVKLGPISLQYVGKGTFVERDESAHRGVIEAQGKDKRGNGTAAATITAQLTPEGDSSTSVIVDTDLKITGRPAQFGRGVIQDVGDKILGQFAACLAETLGPDRGPAPDADSAAGGDSAAEGASGSAGAGQNGQPVGAAAGAGAAGPGLSTPPTGSTTSGSAAGTGGSARSGSSAPRSTPAAAPDAELDLGSVLLPVLAKRLGPLIGGLFVLWLILKIVRRGK